MTTLKLRPYARLLNMLGDQLIKDERIALIEIIKNCFDADASWAKVIFLGFTQDFQMTAESSIVVEDDGTGMSRKVLEDHWVNPATPIKWLEKQHFPKTRKGRILQGEKGIGRFALLKLGRYIKLTTREEGSPKEIEVTLDLSIFDEQLLPAEGRSLFLDELSVDLTEIEPAITIQKSRVAIGARKILRESHGTRIEVSNLKGNWSRAKVERVFQDLARLQSIDFFSETPQNEKTGFEVVIYRDNEFESFSTSYRDLLQELISNQAVLRIENGRYDDSLNRFTFTLNGQLKHLHLRDSDLTGLGVFRRYDKVANISRRPLRCGPFSFNFYVFDLSADKGRFHLDKNDKELIKAHRIYLYRDGIRVYPYGDPDDDWLQIDVARGTIRASEFLSNDQVVGLVQITQTENPQLTDKTSREGLIDKGDPTSDFVFLLQLILAWIRKKPYSWYRDGLKSAVDIDIFKKDRVQGALDSAAEAVANIDARVGAQVAEAAKLYKAERRYLVKRAEDTEHLAGVGLSVETASHDLMVAMHRTLAVLDSLIVESRRPGNLDKAYVERELTMVRGSLSFVQSQMKDLQLLFRSTKQRRKDIVVVDLLRKVQHLFLTALDRNKISVFVDEFGPPLVAKTTDAVLLQVFLNLFDNAIYWLQGVDGPREIRIDLNGADGTLVFADNGPGIKDEDASYIFEPFYSGKGDEGKGLGLYIARQLLERHEYSIHLADLKAHRLLRGANFVVTFIKESER